MLIITAERIKELRERSGLTQTELAKRLSVTRSSVNAWEMALTVPTTYKLIEIAQLFHVTTDYLLGISSCECINIESLNENEKKIMMELMMCFSNGKETS
ncbi:MAG: helix-turn-helix domain-containing protein [Ruminococcus sp.]|nr:helix-turn-helix domain-containing protein [Ruminococcus sp.]